MQNFCQVRLCQWTCTSTPMELSSLDCRTVCDPATTATLPPLLCERVSCPHPSTLVNFNSFLVSTRHCEDLQHVRRAFINVDHLISQDFNDQVIGVWDRDILWCLVRAPCCAQAPHLASAPCLSFSSFCAPLELEPQHFDDYVGVLVRIVLSTSGLWLRMRSLLWLMLFCGLTLRLLFRGMLLLL